MGFLRKQIDKKLPKDNFDELKTKNECQFGKLDSNMVLIA